MSTMQLGRRICSEPVPSCPMQKEAHTVFLILDSGRGFRNMDESVAKELS
jgi:hypothetical protein